MREQPSLHSTPPRNTTAVANTRAKPNIGGAFNGNAEPARAKPKSDILVTPTTAYPAIRANHAIRSLTLTQPSPR